MTTAQRSQRQALDALAFGIGKRRINRVLDCDIQSFFDKVSREWLVRFVEHRIGDRRIIRLIAKWLTAGVLEDGCLIDTGEGTPQGLARHQRHGSNFAWPHQAVKPLSRVAARGPIAALGMGSRWAVEKI